MDSRELSTWRVLYQLHHEEYEAARKGDEIHHGRPPDEGPTGEDDDDEDDEDDVEHG